MNSLNHLAIIMDGNGRWAEKQGKNRTKGHQEGIKIVREISSWCAKNTIKYLTLYAFSTENWRRPKAEVDFLMKLLEKYLKKEAQTYKQNNIRFKAIGNIDIFNQSLKDSIKSLEDKTSKNTALTQILALNYGSRDEIARACKKIIDSNVCFEGIDLSTLIEKNLDTYDTPDVDLLIRTGGEMRLSNFLLWQISYAELFFTPTLWPDFNIEELGEIVYDFRHRDRRFGGL